jgi:elongation factor 1-gamma
MLCLKVRVQTLKIDNKSDFDICFFCWLGTFSFDDFKRVYSNELKDRSDYAIWFGDFNNSLTGDMFQRLKNLRQRAFPSCLLGGDNNSAISGVWVWSRPELAFSWSPDWQIDYQSYNWDKMDVESEETKQLVTQYFLLFRSDKVGQVNGGRHFQIIFYSGSLKTAFVFK